MPLRLHFHASKYIHIQSPPGGSHVKTPTSSSLVKYRSSTVRSPNPPTRDEKKKTRGAVFYAGSFLSRTGGEKRTAKGVRDLYRGGRDRYEIVDRPRGSASGGEAGSEYAGGAENFSARGQGEN